jgi:prepilin-type N-terminal cleavage/methylation domain-containing protein
MIFSGKNCYTLMELVIVLVIVGILARFGLTNFYKARERAFLRQAVAELRMIKDAELAYMLKHSTFTTCTDPTQCSSYLGLAFSDTSNLGIGTTGSAGAAWSYSVAGVAPYCAYAVRATGSYSGCTYKFCCDGSTSDPVHSAGTCP